MAPEAEHPRRSADGAPWQKKLDSINTTIDSMRKSMPNDPYLLQIPSDIPYKPDEKQWKLSLKDTPFDTKDAHLQYLTYKWRDPIALESLLNMITQNNGNTTVARDVSVSKSSLSLKSGLNTPATSSTPRKKINLSDYNKRKKLSESGSTPNGNVSSNLKDNRENTETKPTSPVEQVVSTTHVNQGRTSPGNAEKFVDSHLIPCSPDLINRSQKIKDTKQGSPSPASSTKAKNNLNPSHIRTLAESSQATTQKPAPNSARLTNPLASAASRRPSSPNKAGDVLSNGSRQNPPPWLPDTLRDGRQSTSTESTSSPYTLKALSSPNSLRGSTTSSSTSVEPEFPVRIPATNAFKAAQTHNRNRSKERIIDATSLPASSPFGEDREDARKPTKLSIGKQNSEWVSQQLRQGRSLDSGTKRSMGNDGMQLATSKTTGLSKGTKHPRDEIKEDADSAISKRARIDRSSQQSSNPRTPPSKSTRNGVEPDTPQRFSNSTASTKGRDAKTTPLKNLHATSKASTPLMKASTPVSKSASKTGSTQPRKNDATSAQEWKSEHNRLTKIAITLKRQGQNRFDKEARNKAQEEDLDQTKLAAVEAAASLMYFMTALCALDQCQRSWSGWWDLKTISTYIAHVCEAFPHLEGLVHILRSIIFGRVLSVGAQCIAREDTKNVGILLEASKNMDETGIRGNGLLNRAILKDLYPQAYALSQQQALSMHAEPMIAVRIGWKLLDEWVTREKLQDWTHQLDEGACSNL